MEILAKEIKEYLGVSSQTQAVYDYIFLCFLCGNDFLPHLPSINIRNQGIITLTNAYKHLKNCVLIDKESKEINWKGVRLLFEKLAFDENNRIKHNVLWKLNLRKRMKNIHKNHEKLDCLPCFDTEQEKTFLKNIDNYYSYILKIPECDTQGIQNVALRYLQTLEWTWYYYNGKMLNNNMFYSHSHGPLFRSLLDYIPISNSEKINTIVKDKTKQSQMDSINSTALLFFVLPQEEHKTIIPHYDVYSKEVYARFPQLKINNYDIDYFLCKFFWEGHMMLDNIDVFELNNLVS